ncbi:MAG: hypothetical protein IPO61_07345 [Gammaproteobacteria bacterium]|nr:hypothetical protein [Gammaproteobacteria bacterium]
MTVESLLARLKRAQPLRDSGVSQVSGVQPYRGTASIRYPTDSAEVSGVSTARAPARTDTPDTLAELQGYQREPYGQAACTPDTPDTPRNEQGAGSANGARWLADVARHLETTPDELLAAGLILPEEVPHYLARYPEVMADALRNAHPAGSLHGSLTTVVIALPAPTWKKRCAACQCLVMDDIPRRCFDYQPKPQDHDQRPGRERWPSLEPEVEP